MERLIAFDMTRLMLAPLALAPRGIDRVDLALARQIFADQDGPNVGILPTWRGIRAYPARAMQQIVKDVEDLWSEDGDQINDPMDDPQIQLLIDRILGAGGVRPGKSSVTNSLSTRQRARRMAWLIRRVMKHRGFNAIRSLPRHSTYLNVGQIGLAVPQLFKWLEQRPDIVCAFMLHDVIPLEYPELVRDGHADHHDRMVRTAARYADGLIFATRHARDTVNQVMRRHGRTGVPTLVRTLPLATSFFQERRPIEALGAVRYFVVVSTIEPRKNHRMLLRIWRRLIDRFGANAPHLVIVGARGFDADSILEPLQRDGLLSRHVHELSGLSSAGLMALLLGAQALLSPSLAEGFGLPLLEANLLEVPAIASAIDAHKEVANANTHFLEGDDEMGWENAISGMHLRTGKPAPVIDATFGERAYFKAIQPFLNNLTS